MENKSVSPYDYGYHIEAYSTYHWAIERIHSGSDVLDLGSSIGILCKHLTETMNCHVDIIEYDAATGQKASAYAREAFIGEVDGNLNREEWFQKLKEKRYDYITVMDVLEHCNSPRRVLEKVRGLLKPDGKLIVSLPNIAHNSVILNLLRNRFEYTESGLLDQTHIHFFTYSSARAMLEEQGYCLLEQCALTVPVGRNEIKVAYSDVDPVFEPWLRTRENGNAYQFMFCCSREKAETELPPLSPENPEELSFLSRVFFQKSGDEGFSESNAENLVLPFSRHKKILLDLSTRSAVERIRFTPMSHACILQDVTIRTEEGEALPFEAMNGSVIRNQMIFDHTDPCILIEPNNACQAITIEYSVLSMDEAVINEYGKSIGFVRERAIQDSDVYGQLQNEQKRSEALAEELASAERKLLESEQQQRLLEKELLSERQKYSELACDWEKAQNQLQQTEQRLWQQIQDKM